MFYVVMEVCRFVTRRLYFKNGVEHLFVTVKTPLKHLFLHCGNTVKTPLKHLFHSVETQLKLWVCLIKRLLYLHVKQPGF